MFNLKNGRVHGNGFIQFDLAPGVRFHIWPPADKPLPAQKVNTPVHDHVFGFKSYVLCGMLENVDIKLHGPLSPGRGAYHLYMAEKSPTEDTVLVQQGTVEYALEETHHSWTSAHHMYEMAPFEFHESRNASKTVTATIMFKTMVHGDCKPRVMCPKELKPDNDFSRYSVDQELIKEYVSLVEHEMKNAHDPSEYWRFI